MADHPFSFAKVVSGPARFIRAAATVESVFCSLLWRSLALLVIVAVALALSACEPAPPAPLGTSITAYNFTAEGVQGYWVNGNYGSTLPPYGGGGKSSCCVQLPKAWSADLTVTVDWTIGDWSVPYPQIASLSTAEQIACCWKERSLRKSVPVQPYGKDGGGVQVFFLPDDEVKVWVSQYDLGYEHHISGMAYPRNPRASNHP